LILWKDWVFAQWAKACWHKSQQHRFMSKRKSLTSSLSSKLVLKVRQQDDASCCWVCHGRFHGILPKEYSATFYELPWGLYKEMPTNTQGQSDIVIHQTNIWNEVYLCKRTFFYIIYLIFIDIYIYIHIWFKQVLDWGPEQRESKMTVLCPLIIIILIS
jgi:hypothetical protein